MKKVLIVDDEYLVRLGLRTSFPWALHGFEIVGEAGNGEEALRIFDALAPDILLTDIRMPVMDGIELIRRIKARKPELYVIILTNYDEFSYAQMAIHLGAAQYILKSNLDEQTILNALRLAVDRIETQPGRHDDAQLEYAVRQTLPHRALPVPEFGPELYERLAPGDYVATACRCALGCLTDETRAAFYKTCRAMLESACAAPLIVSSEENDMLLIALIGRMEDDAQAMQLRAEVRAAIVNLRQYYEVELRAGFSRTWPRERLSAMLAQAYGALERCFFSVQNDCEWSENAPVRPSHLVRYHQLEDLIRAGEWEPLKAELSRVFAGLRDAQNLDTANSCCIEMMSIARQIACGSASLGPEFLRQKQLETLRLPAFDHISAMEIYIMDIYRSMLNLLSGRGRHYSSIVTAAINYIRAHYAQTISLGDVADSIEVSKSYLSLLFKQETGINFSKYLLDYRIERARQLLAQPTIRIYEIAERVGFMNPYYFSKVFRECTGMSCREYRDRQGVR